MDQIIEIKRKEFKVLEPLGEHSFKVERKGKSYFLKDYGNNSKDFDHYIKSENKLRTSGIRIPKLYTYDKKAHIIVSEYLEGKTIFDSLLEHDIPDICFEEIFIMNYLCKRNKIVINFLPENFLIVNGQLFYMSSDYKDFEERLAFEKSAIFLWFYSKEFVTYISKKGIPVDQSRLAKEVGATNKQIALTVVKYYR